jgi:hypothetical protein
VAQRDNSGQPGGGPSGGQGGANQFRRTAPIHDHYAGIAEDDLNRERGALAGALASIRDNAELQEKFASDPWGTIAQVSRRPLTFGGLANILGIPNGNAAQVAEEIRKKVKGGPHPECK